MVLPAVILAGGRGSRLKPLTDYLPKPMWFVPGGSLLDHHIRRLNDATASSVIITCAYMADLIAGYIGTRYPHCRVVRTNEEVRTPEDALQSVAHLIAADFIVVHGDHWFSQNPFGDLCSQHAAGEITFLIEKPDESQKSGYDSRCLLETASKKMDYLGHGGKAITSGLAEIRIVDGCYVLPKEFFGIIRRGKAAKASMEGMRQIFSYIAGCGLTTMRGVWVRGWWENINDIETLGKTAERIYSEM